MNPLLNSAHRVVRVEIEYTRRGARVRKVFAGPRAVPDSRAFYRAKLKAGADPKVVGAARPGE
jgi:hypothetical protein